MYFSIVDAESQCGPLDMPALIAAGSGIDVEKIVALVILYKQYVGMPADEDVGPVPVDEGQCLQVIAAGTASDMFQKDFPPFAFEEPELGVDPADILAVTVAVYGHHRFEGSYRVRELKPATEVPGMPELVDRREKLLDFGAENPVCIRNDSYQHNVRYYCNKQRTPPPGPLSQYGDGILPDARE